jgi:hypothetical protein
MGNFQGYLNAALILVMMACVLLILAESGLRCWRVVTGRVQLGAA